MTRRTNPHQGHVKETLKGRVRTCKGSARCGLTSWCDKRTIGGALYVQVSIYYVKLQNTSGVANIFLPITAQGGLSVHDLDGCDVAASRLRCGDRIVAIDGVSIDDTQFRLTQQDRLVAVNGRSVTGLSLAHLIVPRRIFVTAFALLSSLRQHPKRGAHRCHQCDAAFGFLRPKHNCGLCGHVVCSKCQKKARAGDASTNRACLECRQPPRRHSDGVLPEKTRIDPPTRRSLDERCHTEPTFDQTNGSTYNI
ncbi:Aste57867_23430 [Aphanomyces stellatus]|uniref:Aste57867_23430 protein n=1 Tax=Aphanomyces stellatus TaxID=120398 RepID=A0A485LNQ3_9STRA|nr:hypothetical protein As57867_023359 [Aphanomyces stellatus]VFU00076.1 Aste57867_23430 [Aphanomyces stellatus]